MSVLRGARKIVDWLIILGMTCLVIFCFGKLGNLYLPPLGSPIAEWGKISGCFLWLIVPLSITLLAFKTRRWAGYACFLGVGLAVFIPPSIYFLPNREVDPFSSYIQGGIFVALGLYWLLTSAFGSPPVLTPHTQPSRLRRWAFISGGVLACGLGLTWTLFIALAPHLWITCRGVPPTAKARFPGQALFIATDVVSFGKKPALDEPMPFFTGFAIARVQEHFWGLPWWCQKFVLLWRPAQWKGETYFYDGDHHYGLVTHFLPIVSYNACGRTSLVSDAEIDLRVLKDGPSLTSGRIFGHAYHSTEGPWQGVSGIKVTITGPTGDIVTTTDKKGLYDLPGLPPGGYSVHFDTPPKSFNHCSLLFKLAAGQIIECDADFSG